MLDYFTLGFVLITMLCASFLILQYRREKRSLWYGFSALLFWGA